MDNGNGIFMACECPEDGHYYHCPIALMLESKALLQALIDCYYALDGDYMNLSPERHTEIRELLDNYHEHIVSPL